MHTLTPNQLAILTLAAQGQTNAQIAWAGKNLTGEPT